MMLLGFLLLAMLAGLAGVWPMALAAAALGGLLHVAQRTDDAVSAEDTANAAAEGTSTSAGKALLLLLMWLAVGLAGLVVLGWATMEVLP